MFITKRKHLTYANITATLALVFAMSGGALAAHHYLISSTKQISPKVLKKLKGRTGKTGHTGKTGATGATGPAGPAGKEGSQGPQGKEFAGLMRWRTTGATAGASGGSPQTGAVARAGA